MFKNIKTTIEQKTDENLAWIIELLQQHNSKPMNVVCSSDEQKQLLNQFNNLRLNNGKLWRFNVNSSNEESYQYVVPITQRLEIMKYLHCSIVGAHLMYDKIVDNLVDRFYWPTMKSDLKEFIQNCDTCQKTTVSKHKQIAPLQPILPNRPLELVTSDILGPLKETPRNNKYVLSIIDHFTKFIQLFPLANIDAKTVAQQFVKFISNVGMPENILTDQGTQYESQLFEELCAILDINRLHTTAYHKECGGLSERLNRTIEKMLKCLVNHNHDDWDIHLPVVCIAYNTCTHTTTNFPPYELMFNRKMKLPLDLIFEQPTFEVPVSYNDYVFIVRQNSRRMFEIATEKRDKRMAIAKTYYDRKVTAAEFEIDDLVLVLNETVLPYQCKKLKYNYRGPYIVKAIMNNVDYILEPRYGGRTITAHRNNLKRYYQKPLKSGLPIDTVIDEPYKRPTAINKDVSLSTKLKSKIRRPYVKNPKCARWKQFKSSTVASKIKFRLNKKKSRHLSSVCKVSIDELLVGANLATRSSNQSLLSLNQMDNNQSNKSTHFPLKNDSNVVLTNGDQYSQRSIKRKYAKKIFPKVIYSNRRRQPPDRLNIMKFNAKTYI